METLFKFVTVGGILIIVGALVGLAIGISTPAGIGVSASIWLIAVACMYYGIGLHRGRLARRRGHPRC